MRGDYAPHPSRDAEPRARSKRAVLLVSRSSCAEDGCTTRESPTPARPCPLRGPPDRDGDARIGADLGPLVLGPDLVRPLALALTVELVVAVDHAVHLLSSFSTASPMSSPVRRRFRCEFRKCAC